MKTRAEQVVQKLAASMATRCGVCQTRVRRSKDSSSGWRCPGCGRDFDTTSGGNIPNDQASEAQAAE